MQTWEAPKKTAMARGVVPVKAKTGSAKSCRNNIKAKKPMLVTNMLTGVIKAVLIQPKREMNWAMKNEVKVAMIPTEAVT